MISDFEGKVISLDDMVRLPNRNKYLNTAAMEGSMNRQETLEFLPIDVWETYLPEKNGAFNPSDKYSLRNYKLILFGVLKDGQKVVVLLDGINPYFEIRMPTPHAEFANKVKHQCETKGFKVR